MKQTLTYDDVNIIPKYSQIDTRSKIELYTRFTKNTKLSIPIVSSPMDTITELDPFDKIDQIYIEDSLSGFSRGRTSQQTIIKLAKFNAVLTYCLEFAFGEIVEGVNPMTARKQLFGKAREQGKTAKEFVKEQINCLYSLEEYVKLTKTGLWDKRNLDGYDALVCALYE